MKKTVRVAIALMLVAVMALALTACGLDINKVAGKWHVKTINGKTPAEFAAEVGTVEAGVQKVVEISEKETSMTSISGVVTGTTQIRSNGIEATLDGALFPFKYDESSDTLSYTLEQDGTKYEYVYCKGDYDFSAGSAPAAAEEDYGYAEEDYSDYEEE
jgi:hypothetical protein